MNCLDNLGKCNASCCKSVVFVQENLSVDMQYYYKLHGCELIRKSHSLWWIVIPLRCQGLDINNKCIHHENGLKPKVCKNFNESKKSGYHIPKGCIYG